MHRVRVRPSHGCPSRLVVGCPPEVRTPRRECPGRRGSRHRRPSGRAPAGGRRPRTPVGTKVALELVRAEQRIPHCKHPVLRPGASGPGPRCAPRRLTRRLLFPDGAPRPRRLTRSRAPAGRRPERRADQRDQPLPGRQPEPGDAGRSRRSPHLCEPGERRRAAGDRGRRRRARGRGDPHPVPRGRRGTGVPRAPLGQPDLRGLAGPRRGPGLPEPLRHGRHGRAGDRQVPGPEPEPGPPDRLGRPPRLREPGERRPHRRPGPRARDDAPGRPARRRCWTAPALRTRTPSRSRPEIGPTRSCRSTSPSSAS